MNRNGHISPVKHYVEGKPHASLDKLKIMSGKSVDSRQKQGGKKLDPGPKDQTGYVSTDMICPVKQDISKQTGLDRQNLLGSIGHI